MSELVTHGLYQHDGRRCKDHELRFTLTGRNEQYGAGRTGKPWNDVERRARHDGDITTD